MNTTPSPKQVARMSLKSLQNVVLPTTEYDSCQYSHKPVDGGTFADHTTELAEAVAHRMAELLPNDSHIHRTIQQQFGFQTPRHARWARYAVLRDNGTIDDVIVKRGAYTGTRAAQPKMTADQVLAILADVKMSATARKAIAATLAG